MKHIGKFSLINAILFSLILISCKLPSHETEKKPEVDRRQSYVTAPDWISRASVYEVNIRQYTREGSFREFESHLARLRDMGVDILWFMPVHPISKTDRKGSLGSYYAVADYYGINPEFGDMEDFKTLVRNAQRQGMKVIIDWVPNHTGADHYWLESHPEFYVRDSTGNPQYAFDWSDTRELNYDNTAMRDSMVAAMQYWVKETGIDGFRVDVASEVPADFWEEAIPKLRKLKPLFLLAEADNAELHKAGFNASYPWEVFHVMKGIAAGERNALALDSVIKKNERNFPKGSGRLYFTSNHDENSWNKSDYETFPGEKHAPFAVLTHFLPGAIPLIYSGQEEPVLRAIPFFEKDHIEFKNFERAGFYRTLLKLRDRNKAMDINATSRIIKTGDEKRLFAIFRQEGSYRIFVVANLSDSTADVQINLPELTGSPKDIFTNKPVKLTLNSSFTLGPWEYRVLEY